MASDQPIVIKKVKKGGDHGHHGGAWKVAYADFVTAMMAFFLLMWLINTTDIEQKQGIANYFDPASVTRSESGSGSILEGGQLGEDGQLSRGSASVLERLAPRRSETGRRDEADPSEAGGADALPPDLSTDAIASALARREAAEARSAEQSLRQALQDMPELAELSRHILIDTTPEGVRIQLVDEDGRSMFDPGSVEPNERARVLLRGVAQVVSRLPNRLSISGHTDASPPAATGPSNWELSADRANAARAVMEGAGVDGDRIAEVRGKAGTEPLFPDDPYLPGNRRLSIVLLREAPLLPSGGGL